MTVASVVPAEGWILERILDVSRLIGHDGLDRAAAARFEAAQVKTDWAIGHRRRFALVAGANVLASALQYDLTGVLDEQPVRLCGIGDVLANPGHGDGHDAQLLIERLVDAAARDGAGIAFVFVGPDERSFVPDGFASIPVTEVDLTVAESPRYGAPMTLVRGGEDRDLPAIVAMGRIRASQFRYHTDRDVDLVKYAITRLRLLAGLAPAGVRELHFVIAEEGITAAAYVVLTSVEHTWTIEECGDRDGSGARVGALLQALIARDPSAPRPRIRAWLPPGFLPPQLTIRSAGPASESLMMRSLKSSIRLPRLTGDDVLCWRSDLI